MFLHATKETKQHSDVRPRSKALPPPTLSRRIWYRLSHPSVLAVETGTTNDAQNREGGLCERTQLVSNEAGPVLSSAMFPLTNQRPRGLRHATVESPTPRPHLDNLQAVVRHLLLGHALHGRQRGKVNRPPLGEFSHDLPSDDVVRRHAGVGGYRCTHLHLMSEERRHCC